MLSSQKAGPDFGPILKAVCLLIGRPLAPGSKNFTDELPRQAAKLEEPKVAASLCGRVRAHEHGDGGAQASSWCPLSNRSRIFAVQGYLKAFTSLARASVLPGDRSRILSVAWMMPVRWVTAMTIVFCAISRRLLKMLASVC